MLICPTDVGLFVGVDLVTGRQRWVHGYRIGEAGQRREYFPAPLGWDGIPTWPVIHRDRVLLLSRFSEELHCLETTTGKLLWQVPRGNAVYIGAVTDDRIVLVGERDVRAIPMPADGAVGAGETPAPQRVGGLSASEPVPALWTQLVGPMTGRGVRVGDDLLVPLKSGRVACLEIATGRDRGFAVTRTIDSSVIRRRSSQADDGTGDDPSHYRFFIERNPRFANPAHRGCLCHRAPATLLAEHGGEILAVSGIRSGCFRRGVHVGVDSVLAQRQTVHLFPVLIRAQP